MARRNTSLILSASKGNLEPKHWNIPHKRNYLQPKQQWIGQHSYKYTPPTLNVDLSRETLAGAPSFVAHLIKIQSKLRRVTVFSHGETCYSTLRWLRRLSQISLQASRISQKAIIPVARQNGDRVVCISSIHGIDVNRKCSLVCLAGFDLILNLQQILSKSHSAGRSLPAFNVLLHLLVS